jgi:non-heme chloroperoxidase
LGNLREAAAPIESKLPLPASDSARSSIRLRDILDSLDRVDQESTMTESGNRTPVVFVHGLWLHADSWGAWIDLFREAGYDPTAPGWPGDSSTVEETRSNAERVAGFGIDAVVDHYAKAIAGLDTKPIVIGHSFGGLVVQRLLGQDLAAAAVAIDPAPIKGVLSLPVSALRVASIALRNPANKKRAVALTAEQFRYGFGNALSAVESNELYERWTIPSPGRPLFEAAMANFSPRSPAKVNTANATRGPLLLTAGGDDHTVPPSIVKGTLKLYRKSPAVTELKEFPGKGHSLALDNGWREVADSVLGWLRERSL